MWPFRKRRDVLGDRVLMRVAYLLSNISLEIEEMTDDVKNLQDMVDDLKSKADEQSSKIDTLVDASNAATRALDDVKKKLDDAIANGFDAAAIRAATEKLGTVRDSIASSTAKVAQESTDLTDAVSRDNPPAPPVGEPPAETPAETPAS